jgi:hypothetical protein
MGWEIRVKFVVGVVLGATSVVFITGCSDERAESPAFVVYQYNQTDHVVPADACSVQTKSPAIAGPAAKQEPVAVTSTQPANTSVTQFESRSDLTGLTSDTPFGRAIEVMRNCTRPPLNIVVFWNDLRDNAGIDTQTPIGVDLVRGISLRKNLEIMLTSLSTRQTKIDYTIIDGVIVIATKNSLPKNMQLRSYDITDLASRPADYHSESSNTGAANQGR